MGNSIMKNHIVKKQALKWYQHKGLVHVIVFLVLMAIITPHMHLLYHEEPIEVTPEAEVGIVLEVKYEFKTHNVSYTVIKTNIGTFPLKGVKSIVRGSTASVEYDRHGYMTCMKFQPSLDGKCYSLEN